MTLFVEDEIWKTIPGHEPYQASNLGNIRNGDCRVLKPVKIGLKGKQYFAVYVGGGKKALKGRIHRLVLMAFMGMPEKGQIACHRNDIQTDNRLENLYWGTLKSNAQDQIRLGNFHFAVGEKNGMTRYSDKIVRKIRDEYTGKRGEQSALALKYEMSVSNVNYIVRGMARVA